MPPSLATPVELDLHRRLLARDAVASAELADQYLGGLVGWLMACNPTVDTDLCHDAAGDAILSLIKNPTSYDPRQLALAAYLRMSAKGDLKNILKRERRRNKGRRSLESVELSADARNPLGRDDDPSLPLRIAEEAREVHDAIPASVRDGLSEVERRVLDLMLSGERKTETYARACGIEHQPREKQRKEVKRMKDRLTKRLERGGADE